MLRAVLEPAETSREVSCLVVIVALFGAACSGSAASGTGGTATVGDVASGSGAPSSSAQQSSATASIEIEREPRKPETTRALVPGAAKLPTAIVGLESAPLMLVAGEARLFSNKTWDDPAKPPSCATTTSRKLRSMFWPQLWWEVDDKLEHARFELVYGDASLAEIAACIPKLNGYKRTPHKDKRLAIFEREIVADVGDGMLLHYEHPTDKKKSLAQMTRLLSSGSTGPNPLGRVLEHGVASAQWTAVALDYTWDLLGVSSIGAIFEYDKQDEAGPITIRVLFDDAAAAKLALERFAQPDDIVFRSAFGESAERLMGILRTQAKISIRDNEIIVRGQVSKADWDGETPFGVFRGLAVPLWRPLTSEQEGRLLRALPGTPRAKLNDAKPWKPGMYKW